MHKRSLIMLLVFQVLWITLGLQLCSANPTCTSPYTKTDGEYLISTEHKYFTAQPFETIENTTTMKCTLKLTGNLIAQSMNVVGINHSDVACQLFESKAAVGYQQGILVNKQDSVYHEKTDVYLKATSDVIVVGAKDDKPGTFTFQLPTGYYKIRLNHLDGKVACRQGRPASFACINPRFSNPSNILLFEGYKEKRVTWGTAFSEFGGSISNAIFVATTQCFHLKEGSTYSFWYWEDYADEKEHDNSGETSFEMFARLCEKNNGCM